jgi:hypothetical protein
MSWKRVKSHKYYYHNYKHNGKVCTSYFGRGPLAEAVSWLYTRKRERRAEARAEQERLATIERRVVGYCEGVGELLAAWMRLNGWHRHHGQWRRNGKITRRHMLTPQEMDRLIEAENARREFEAGNVAELISRYGGDLAASTIETIISTLTDDVRKREALRRQAATIRDRHAGPNPTDIELALAERIAILYMNVYKHEQLACLADGDEAEDGLSIHEAEFLERRLDRADRRYRAALGDLARVRKLEASTTGQLAGRFKVVG